MFKRKKREPIKDSENGDQKPVVGSGGSRLRLPSKKKMMVIGAVLVVAAGVFAAVLYIRNDNGADGDDHTEEVMQQTPADEAALEALNSYNPETGEGYEEAIAALDNGFSGTDGDKAQEAQIYLNKTSVYMNAKQFQQALEAAKQAESLAPNNASSAFIARASQELGDNATAAKYYQITIDRIKALEFHSDTDIEHYEELLKEVKAE